ncbi:MAG: cytochrome P450, partial [Candidatus Binatia bacterium]
MDYNPFLPEVQQNPYPYYAYLREHAPVYQIPGVGFWAVSRYADVLAVIKNPHVFSSANMVGPVLGDLNPFPPEAPSLIELNPPVHTVQRKIINRAFTPRRIATLEAHLREVVHHLIEQIAARGHCDLMSDLAIPLPVTVIAELLGVPVERRHDFKRWTTDMVRAMQAFTVTEREEIRQSLTEWRTYFEEMIAEYRKQPKDNLLSDLVRAEEEDERLTAAQLLSTACLLLIGGNETTTNLIGNAVLALFTHPQELAKVRANPALVPNLVEETLRYDAPIQFLLRQTTQEVE